MWCGGLLGRPPLRICSAPTATSFVHQKIWPLSAANFSSSAIAATTTFSHARAAAAHTAKPRNCSADPVSYRLAFARSHAFQCLTEIASWRESHEQTASPSRPAPMAVAPPDRWLAFAKAGGSGRSPRIRSSFRMAYLRRRRTSCDLRNARRGRRPSAESWEGWSRPPSFCVNVDGVAPGLGS